MNPYRSEEMHECGGTIIAGGEIAPDVPAYYLCDGCGAFRFHDAPGFFPTGIDADANRDAWDAGDLRSPDAPEDPPDPDYDGPMVPTGGA